MRLNWMRNMGQFDRDIKAEPIGCGQYLVWGLRDLPGRPHQGGRYLAAKCYDQHTADLLVKVLRDEAEAAALAQIALKAQVADAGCRLPIATISTIQPKARRKGKAHA